MSDFYPYQNAAVRDLAWACFCAPLLRVARLDTGRDSVDDAAFELTPGRRLWLEQLDRDATPLLGYLAAPRITRLGLYFERLWQFFLRQDSEVELVAHNLPVADGGRTLGEFDCIYLCRRRNTHVHLELAVKFYLGVPGAPAERAWVGPDVRDRLDRKLARLLEHQVGLADASAARRQLTALGIGELRREVALRGYLFQPEDAVLPAPAGYNPARPFSNWCRREALAGRLESATDTRFRLLDRLQWLSPARWPPRATHAAAALAAAIDERFALRLSPVLVAALDAAGEERSRFFVVPPGWPDSAPTTT